jgi:NADPH:quinone reductase-like Zn-dependent oxidoreductase
MGDPSQLEVVRADLHRTRLVEAPVPTLGEGEVLLAVDAFGLTANNVTYAAFGDMLGYWKFFPAEGEWGRIPVWGFADVVASEDDRLAVGARVYGYLPMGTHLVVAPARVGAHDFVDGSAHRADLPRTYNTYQVVSADPSFDADREDERMLLWPLFVTSFLIVPFMPSLRYPGSRTATAKAMKITTPPPRGTALV